MTEIIIFKNINQKVIYNGSFKNIACLILILIFSPGGFFPSRNKKKLIQLRNSPIVLFFYFAQAIHLIFCSRKTIPFMKGILYKKGMR